MNEKTNRKKVLNVKVSGKCSRSRQEQRVRKDVTWKEGGP